MIAFYLSGRSLLAQAPDPYYAGDPFPPQPNAQGQFIQGPLAQQPFAQQPQFNSNNYMLPGPPGDPGTPTRPTGWPGSPPPEADSAPAATGHYRQPASNYRAAPAAGQGNYPPPANAGSAAAPRAVATGVAPAQPVMSGAPPSSLNIPPYGAMPPGSAPPPYQPPAYPHSDHGSSPYTNMAPADGTSHAQPAPRVENPQEAKIDFNDFGGARKIAQIGTEVVQEYEVSAVVDEYIEKNASRIPSGQVAALREKLMKDRLNLLIEVKLGLVDAQRKIPSEAYPKVVESIGDEFEKTELRNKLKELGLKSRSELDAKLREQGTSLEREKQAYIEQSLAFGWVREQTRIKHEITHEDMLAYYLAHAEDYDFPAKARWEELRIKVSNYPSREAARFALGAMGNEVIRGANFGDVARARSQGPTAAAGGAHDWTTKGSFAIDTVDQALFALPVGQMSPILDNGRAPTISIVRVIERTDAGRKPFSDVQDDIKKKLDEQQKEKERERIHDYIARLRADTPIWTIFDGDLHAEKSAQAGTGTGQATASTSMRPTDAPAGDKTPDNPYLR